MREDSAGKNPAGAGSIDAPSSGTAGHKNGDTAKGGKRDALLDAEGAEDAVAIRDACKVREAYRGAAPEVLQSISSLMDAEDANADGFHGHYGAGGDGELELGDGIGLPSKKSEGVRFSWGGDPWEVLRHCCGCACVNVCAYICGVPDMYVRACM